jgi:hypothetical protein
MTRGLAMRAQWWAVGRIPKTINDPPPSSSIIHQNPNSNKFQWSTIPNNPNIVCSEKSHKGLQTKTNSGRK